MFNHSVKFHKDTFCGFQVILLTDRQRIGANVIYLVEVIRNGTGIKLKLVKRCPIQYICLLCTSPIGRGRCIDGRYLSDSRPWP